MIKRILGVFLAGLVLFGYGLAEIDVDSMTLSEKIALYSQLRELIADELDQKLLSDNIGPGTYLVGADIKAGRYCFTASSETQFHCLTYVSEEACNKFEAKDSIRLYAGEEAYIQLNEGMVLKVDTGTAYVQTVETPSWAP